MGDATDPNIDGDGLANTTDQLHYDAQNGSATAVPLAFEWNPGDAPLGKIANSGFTGAQIATVGPRLNTTAINVGAAGGFLAIGTSAGTAQATANSQVNALQVGFNSSTAFRVWTRIVEPFNSVTAAIGHVAAVFFGPDQDNYVRLGIIGGSGGAQSVQVATEIGGVFTEVATLPLGRCGRQSRPVPRRAIQRRTRYALTTS